MAVLWWLLIQLLVVQGALRFKDGGGMSGYLHEVNMSGHRVTAFPFIKQRRCSTHLLTKSQAGISAHAPRCSHFVCKSSSPRRHVSIEHDRTSMGCQGDLKPSLCPRQGSVRQFNSPISHLLVRSHQTLPNSKLLSKRSLPDSPICLPHVICLCCLAASAEKQYLK